MNNLNSEYNSILSFSKSTLSDLEASIAFNHKKEDQSTHIVMKDGIDLYIFGCITVHSPSGIFLSGEEVLSYFKLNYSISPDRIFSYINGEVEIPVLDEYKVVSRPYFEWQERDGETVGELFDTIPSDIEKLSVPE